MGKTRKRWTRLVYYRKKRFRKRVFSVYVGSGEVGELAEREDREQRETRRSAVSAPSESPEVLQSAPEGPQGATRGATPQVVADVPVIKPSLKEMWDKSVRTKPPVPR